MTIKGSLQVSIAIVKVILAGFVPSKIGPNFHFCFMEGIVVENGVGVLAVERTAPPPKKKLAE